MKSASRRSLEHIAALSLVLGACGKAVNTEATPSGGSGGAGASGAGSIPASGSGGSSGASGGVPNAGGSGSAGSAGTPGATGGTSGGAGQGSSGADAGTVAGDAGATQPSEYTLIDFAGASTGSSVKQVADWDIREKFSFGVSGDHTSSATVEVVNSQATLAFARPNPSVSQTGNVLRLVKIPASTGNGDNWGGWAHVIFDLGGPLPLPLVQALPQWDSNAGQLVAGTKVVQLDVYYDDGVDPNFDWAKLLAIEEHGNVDVFDAEPARGYVVHLQLVGYAAHANFAGAHDAGGIYIGYTAYLTAPNQWQTLTFDAADVGRADNYYGSGAELAALPTEITGIDIKPAGGYDAADENPLYVRNLRIVDAP